MKKVALVGTVGLPANYGGWETLSDQLVTHLEGKVGFTVFCSALRYKDKLTHFKSAQLEYIKLDANGFQSILYDAVSLFKSRKNYDAILVLGISGAIFLPLFRLFCKTPVILNIDGIEWKRDKWNGLVKRFLHFSEWIGIKFSDEVVTDNKAIQDYVYQMYGEKSSLIAYGGDQVEKLPLSADIISRYPFLKNKYAFSVCRIEPENNLHLILSAFSQITDIDLIIVGNWDNSDYGSVLRDKYKSDSIHLLDPIFEPNLLNQLRSNCNYYIHGHSAGGTNPSLVEAMSLGLPIFAFDVSFNRFTTENNAFYFSDSEDLIMQVKSVNDDQLCENADAMKDIANTKYRWKIIADQYLALF